VNSPIYNLIPAIHIHRLGSRSTRLCERVSREASRFTRKKQVYVKWRVRLKGSREKPDWVHIMVRCSREVGSRVGGKRLQEMQSRKAKVYESMCKAVLMEIGRRKVESLTARHEGFTSTKANTSSSQARPDALSIPDAERDFPLDIPASLLGHPLELKDTNGEKSRTCGVYFTSRANDWQRSLR
jgi:hypothetical protein